MGLQKRPLSVLLCLFIHLSSQYTYIYICVALSLSLSFSLFFLFFRSCFSTHAVVLESRGYGWAIQGVHTVHTDYMATESCPKKMASQVQYDFPLASLSIPGNAFPLASVSNPCSKGIVVLGTAQWSATYNHKLLGSKEGPTSDFDGSDSMVVRNIKRALDSRIQHCLSLIVQGPLKSLNDWPAKTSKLFVPFTDGTNCPQQVELPTNQARQGY